MAKRGTMTAALPHKESGEVARARRQVLYRDSEFARLRCQMMSVGLAEILNHAYSGADVLNALALVPEVELAAKAAKDTEDVFRETKPPVTLGRKMKRES